MLQRQQKWKPSLVLYPDAGSIAEKSVKTLLNSADFTIFKLALRDQYNPSGLNTFRTLDKEDL